MLVAVIALPLYFVATLCFVLFVLCFAHHNAIQSIDIHELSLDGIRNMCNISVNWTMENNGNKIGAIFLQYSQLLTHFNDNNNNNDKHTETKNFLKIYLWITKKMKIRSMTVINLISSQKNRKICANKWFLFRGGRWTRNRHPLCDTHLEMYPRLLFCVTNDVIWWFFDSLAAIAFVAIARCIGKNVWHWFVAFVSLGFAIRTNTMKL